MNLVKIKKNLYEIKCISKTVNFIKKIVKKTYKITKVISDCGVVSRITIAVVTIIFAFGLKFGDVVEETLQDQEGQVFPNVNMRGIKGRGYFSEKVTDEGAGFFVGIHMEGQFKGQIKKAQPVSEQ